MTEIYIDKFNDFPHNWILWNQQHGPKSDGRLHRFVRPSQYHVKQILNYLHVNVPRRSDREEVEMSN